MSGKRLLDAIQFLNVAKSVATKHVAVRQRQLDVFTRTSSITKGVKSRADGVILTAQAAAALAKRFNEPSTPSSAPKTDNSSATTQPSSASRATQETGPEQRSSTLSADEAKKHQRQAEFQIPSLAAEHTSNDGMNGLNVSRQQDVFYKPSQESTPELSSLPRKKMPQTTADGQGSVGLDINADVFHSSMKTGESTPVTDKEELPDEIMQNIFHSPRVANMLSGKKSPLDKGADSRTSRYSRRPTEQSTSTTRTEDAKQAEKKDMENIGSSIADNVAAVPEVSI